MYARIILVGNLGNDPEMRYTPSGQPVTHFSLATNRRWTDKESGEQKKETTWFRVSVWGKQAENVNEYLKKGRMALVEADRIQARAYLNSEGQPAASLEVTASNVRFIGGGRGEEGGAGAPVEPPEDLDAIPF
jgi:single-strand DNA-binding protein